MPEFTIQRLRGRYAVKWYDESGKPHRNQLAATDRPSAEAEARARFRTIARPARTVGQIIPAYIDDRERAGIATATRMRDAWKAMRHFWQDVEPHLIDEDMARDYARRRNRAAATVRYELAMIAVALKWAKVPNRPEIWRPQVADRKQRHITRAEFRRFLEAVRAPHAKLYMILGIATCARPTALLELTWDRVDFDRGLIDLNPPGRVQTGKRRPVIAIADYAMQPLREAHAARQSDFVIEYAGQPVASMKKAFLAASERSGVKVTPYTLRHTGAVWRAEDGVSMAELAQLMGHDDSRTTERHYARFSPDFLRRAANAGGW